MEHLNALPTGTRLGEYEIEAVLGAGGFGITYRAQDVNLGKIVAIKEYLPRDFAMRTNARTVVPTSSADRADYEWGLRRFVDEARTLARFNHPHLNKVQRYFEAHGTAYLVLDYVEGETLSAVLQRQGRLSEAVVTRLLRDVLNGVEEVHAAGYVHRDLKPGNLMVQPDGSIMVLDFGAARQAVGQRSKSITSILTPGYAPIEQYDTKAEDVGPWSDLYALGMVAYRCISGLEDKQIPDAVTRSRAARKGSGDLEPATSIGRGRYDAWLLRAIDWAIQIEEDERPQSIAAWRQGMPPLAHSQGYAGPLTRAPVRRRAAPTVPRWATVAGVVALVVAVAGGAYWYVQQSGLPVDGLPIAVSRQAERPAPQESLESAPPAPAPEPRQTASATPATEEPVPEAAVPEPPDHAAMEAALELEREERVLVQQGLVAAGQEPGPADGLFGGETTRTRQAIRAWQAAKGLAASGYLTREQADTLMALGQEAEAQRTAQAAAEREAQAEATRQARAADDAAYAEAQQADTAAAYAEYLRAYPTGQHVQEARDRESARRAEQRVQADDAAYARAVEADTAAAYGEYLAAYPQGRHAAEARERQARLQWRVGQTFSDTLRSGGQGPEMVVVPTGSFQMGCVSGRDCEDDEQPVHQVTIEQPFAVGVYEVTFAEYDRFASATGRERPDDEGWGRGRRPVINVSWADAVAYTQWLSQETGRRYRLLSEAEWEHVARAGTTTAYSWGDSIGRNRANCDGCGSQWEPGFFGGGQTAPVGSFAANGWGLHDVHGNAYEWVQDCWNDSYAGAPSDGRAWESGDCSLRVRRGGSWHYSSWSLHSADRDDLPAFIRRDNLGFRIARSLP